MLYAHRVVFRDDVNDDGEPACRLEYGGQVAFGSEAQASFVLMEIFAITLRWENIIIGPRTLKL